MLPCSTACKVPAGYGRLLVGEVVKGTRRLEIVSEATSGDLHPLTGPWDRRRDACDGD